MNKHEQEEYEYQRLISKKCADCTHCNNSRCSLHNRQVDTEYNKCLYHSDNEPSLKTLPKSNSRGYIDKGAKAA